MSNTVHGIVVRPVEEDDFASLLPLLFEMGHVDSESGVIARLGEKSRRRDQFIPVALVGGEIAGYAWAQDYGPHLRGDAILVRLHDLFVSPGWRRREIGRRLFESVRLWAGKRGARWMQWQANEQALPFYQKLGYRGDSCLDPDHPFFEITFE